MFSLQLENEGPSTCNALVMVLGQGKTNQYGKVEYGAVLRNKNVSCCAINALAMYFFYRWHISDEIFPDLLTKQTWYDIHTLKGKDRTKPIAYHTQADPLNKLKRETNCLAYHVRLYNLYMNTFILLSDKNILNILFKVYSV
jgi:hypothetical protein